MSPDIALSGGVVVDSAHSGFGSVRGTEVAGLLFHDLSKMSGSSAQAGS